MQCLEKFVLVTYFMILEQLRKIKMMNIEKASTILEPKKLPQ
jgi:hypothetical protein